MWTYGILYLGILLVFGAGSNESCLIDHSLDGVEFNLITNYRVERTQRLGIWEYELSMSLKWNVSADVVYDGIMYTFSDATSGGGPQAPPFIGGPSGLPCNDLNSTIWTVDSSGASIQCQIPCEGILGNQCSYGGICNLLGSGYTSLSKETRSLRLPMRFGQRYLFKVHLYRGWRYGAVERYHLLKMVAFCRHELITKFQVDEDDADEYCKENQVIDDNSFTTGPIPDLEFVERRINMSSNRFEVVLRWKDPHDVHPKTKVIRYNAYLTNAAVINSTELKVSSKSPDGYYQATFGNIKFNETVIVRITPVTDTSHCQIRCKNYGRTYTEVFEFDDIDGCTENNETNPFCVGIAECEDLPPDGNIAALCSCPEGYVGNGRSPNYDGGTGCEILDGCKNTTLVDIVCAQSAICQRSSSSSSMYFNCSCPKGYYGDGYRDGTGCTYDTSTEIAVIVTVCVVALIIILVILLAFYFRKRQRDLRFKLTSQFQVSLFNTIKNSNSDSTAGIFGQKWELDRDSIELKGIIGRGNFGVVHRAVLKTEDGEESVAVKMTTDAASEEYKQAFKHEICLLSEIDKHENLLGLIGCCTAGNQQWYMVTQFMKYGDLLHFLWKSRETKYHEEDPIYQMNELSVYQIAGQVASGMHHLKKMRIIHGDLAARNILVGEGLSCKISDFGLANNVYEEGMLRNVVEKTVPLRWVSPERMMDGQVPIDWRSDVWSYGVLLFETVTLGATPYAGIESEHLFEKLKSGYRMQRPSFCTQPLYNMMLQCWEWRPSKRPTFSALEKMMKDPAQPSSVTYVNLHTVVSELDPREDTSNTTNSSPRTIANNFAQSFTNESEKLV